MWFIQSQSQRPAGSKTGRRGHSTSRLPAHRFDESPDDYSLASCSPAELASASPSASQLALDRPAERSLTIKRQVVHICRVSPMGGSPSWGPETYAQNGKYRGKILKELPAWYVENQPRPSSRRQTFCWMMQFTGKEPLAPSGLLGPVTLAPMRRIEFK